jgi:predicted small integral membrane protein
LCAERGDQVKGLIGLVQALRLPLAAFENAKRIPLIALTLSLLMWLVAFLAVGGEWFLMWQSHTWNGQDAAFRNFSVVGIVLLFLLRPETETQP